MAFFEELFPPRISREAEGGPRFINSKAYSASGQRITNREAKYPLHEYTIAHPPRKQEDFEALRAFFYFRMTLAPLLAGLRHSPIQQVYQ